MGFNYVNELTVRLILQVGSAPDPSARAPLHLSKLPEENGSGFARPTNIGEFTIAFIVVRSPADGKPYERTFFPVMRGLPGRSRPLPHEMLGK